VVDVGKETFPLLGAGVPPGPISKSPGAPSKNTVQGVERWWD
jgi:hypothetical protein